MHALTKGESNMSTAFFFRRLIVFLWRASLQSTSLLNHFGTLLRRM